jgi:hypothetical protein
MQDFSPSALETLHKAADASGRQLHLRVHPKVPENRLSIRMLQIAHVVAEGCGERIGLTIELGAHALTKPQLGIECDGRKNLTYLSAPEGAEAQPVLELLNGLLTANPTVNSRKAAVDQPADLQVFIAAGCPSCPHAVRAAAMIAVGNPQVSLSVVDAVEFPELAERWRVKSVPMTIIDDEVALNGVVSVMQLRRVLRERQGPDHERRMLEGLLEAGRFEDAGAECGSGRLRDAFAVLWRRSTFEQRIRLMLVAEHALEYDSSCLLELAPSLLPALRSDDRALCGDTADLLGKIGNDCAEKELRRLQADPDPEIREAADDALAHLTARDS